MRSRRAHAAAGPRGYLSALRLSRCCGAWVFVPERAIGRAPWSQRKASVPPGFQSPSRRARPDMTLPGPGLAVHHYLTRVAEDDDLLAGLDHVVTPRNRLVDEFLKHVVIHVLACSSHDAAVGHALRREQFIDPGSRHARR